MPLDADRIQHLVARTWRDLSWVSVVYPDQGMDHAVIVLEGVSSKEGELADLIPERVVVRVPHTAEYRDQAMLESSLIAQLFRGTKVRVPETVRQAYARGTFNTASPIILTLQSYVDGEPLDAEQWSEMTDQQRLLAVEQLGSLLATMHSMPADVLPVSKVEPWWLDGAATQQLNTNPRALPGKLELMRARLDEYLLPHLSPRQVQHVEQVLAHVDSLLARPGQQRCLTHGDLYPGHLLWDATGVGVIDFSDMTVGDPALDYAHFAGIAPELPELVMRQAMEHAAGRFESEAKAEPLYEPGLLERAAVFKRWDDIFLAIDHYRTGDSELPDIPEAEEDTEA